MAQRAFATTLALLSMFTAGSAPAQDLAGYLSRYFSGSAIQYGSGTGLFAPQDGDAADRFLDAVNAAAVFGDGEAGVVDLAPAGLAA